MCASRLPDLAEINGLSSPYRMAHETLLGSAQPDLTFATHKDKSSSEDESHPSLTEPDATLSCRRAFYPRPPVLRHFPRTNSLGSRPAMRPSQCVDAHTRRLSRMYFDRCASPVLVFWRAWARLAKLTSTPSKRAFDRLARSEPRASPYRKPLRITSSACRSTVGMVLSRT